MRLASALERSLIIPPLVFFGVEIFMVVFDYWLLGWGDGVGRRILGVQLVALFYF